MSEIPTFNAIDPQERRHCLDALKAFYAAWKSAAVYDENNRAYQTRRAELAAALAQLAQSGMSFDLVYQNDYFFVNGQRLNYDRDFAFGRQLAVHFSELHLGGIAINPDAGHDQIDHALFALAQADRRILHPFEALSETWSTLGITAVTISPLTAHSHPGLIAEKDTTTRRRHRARALFQRSEAVVRDFWERVRDRNSFDASSVQRVVHQLIDEVAHDEDILMEFSALKDFDEYTFYHSVNVSIYAIAVGMRLGLRRAQLAHLGMAALMHDIGKVKLSRDLITKPTEFDEEDWVQIKRHPILGALTIAGLRPIDAPVGAAMAAAFEHHLKMDLSGYPEVTRKRDLHLFSRIVTVCDVFDAMTAGRVYQKIATPPDEALRRLLYKGREWYDSLILKAFVSVVGIFPVGSLVRLSDQRVGIVIRNDTDDLYCPFVLVIRSAAGEKMSEEVHLKIDAGVPRDERLHIAAVLEPHKEGIDIYEYIGRIDEPEAAEEALPVASQDESQIP